ncbi:hypothetical protein [Brevundimonas sp. Leaf363]|uniref:hypothetical protein n=1 Tax=Brevundimonas sp. Leaf363 TaxID=1736353 RepID=UPI000B238C53|nr:hypothetical protein [Brevundimonas sp. Leaf363]
MLKTSKAFDLHDYADALPRGKTRTKLLSAIRGYLGIKSVIRDLTHAREVMRILGEHQAKETPGRQTLDSALLGRALFNQALLLYVGATKTVSHSRPPFDGWRMYSENDRKRHKVICDLRDNAIAHYGPGGELLRQPWVEDRLALVVNSQTDMLHLKPCYKISATKGVLSDDLRALIELALSLAELRVNPKAEDLFNLLRTEHGAGQDLLEKSPFDPMKFFDNEPAAAAFWETGPSETNMISISADRRQVVRDDSLNRTGES